MSKPDEPWLRACKRLAIGGSRRFRCCGATPAAILYNKPLSWEMYCNRCKRPAVVKKQMLRIQAPVQERPVQPVPAQLKHVPQLPADEQHWIWTFLQSKGLDPLILPSEEFMVAAGRLIIPFGGGALGRALSPQLQPKWVQYAGQGTKPPHYLWLGMHRARFAMVVEDPFSAKKLAYAAKGEPITVYCTLGTRAHADLRVEIAAAGHERTLVWYDGDLGGDRGLVLLRKALRPYTKVSTYSVHGCDPKDLQLPEIKEVLNGLCSGESPV